MDDFNEITGTDCQCASLSTTAECTVGQWCWSDNTCQVNAKPVDCSTSDTIAISVSDCACVSASTTADCIIGKYCWTDNSCNDVGNCGF